MPSHVPKPLLGLMNRVSTWVSGPPAWDDSEEGGLQQAGARAADEVHSERDHDAPRTDGEAGESFQDHYSPSRGATSLAV